MTLAQLVGLLFTWGLAPLVLFLLAARIFRLQSAADGFMGLALCLGLGPAVISRVLTVTLTLAPGHDNSVYLAAIGAFFALLLPATRPGLPVLRLTLAAMGHGLRSRAVSLATTLVLTGGILTLLWTTGLGRMVANLYLRQTSGSFPGLTAHYPSPLADWLLMLVVLMFFGARLLKAMPASVGRFSGWPSPLPVLALVLSGALLCLALRPMFENDAMQYMHVASWLYRAKTTAIYPVVTPLPDGYYAVSSHPLAYYGMLVWSYLIQGTADGPGIARLVAPLFLLATLPVLAVALRHHGRTAQWLAACLYLSAGAIFDQASMASIDATRLCLLAAALVWAELAITSPGVLPLVWAGMAAGLSIYSHSLNTMVTLPMIGAVLITARAVPWRRRLMAIIIVGGVALVLGGEQMARNWLRFGSPVDDVLPIYALVPSLDYVGFREAQLALTSWTQRFLTGEFIGFSNWYWFQLSWWLALLALIRWPGRLLACSGSRAAAVATLAFMGGMALFFLGSRGSVDYALNQRYMATIQPQIAILGAIFLAGLAQHLGGLGRAVATGTVLFSSVAVLGNFLVPHLDQIRLPPRFDLSRTEELAAIDQAAWSHPYYAELTVLPLVTAAIPPGDRVLTFHQNTFAFYAQRHLVRDVDPALVEFYGAKDASEAAKQLAELHIGWVYLPPWQTATRQHSRIEALVASTDLAELVVDKAKYRLYRLTPPGTAPAAVSPGSPAGG